jgi:putative membrane protein
MRIMFLHQQTTCTVAAKPLFGTWIAARRPRNREEGNHMGKSTIAIIACLGTTLGGAAIMANAENMDAAPTSAQFVQKAGEGGMAEVEISKLAASKAQSPDVKKFAEQMVKDHGKANTELTGIAKQKSLEVPKSVSAEHKAGMEKLKSASGAEFDATYMAMMKKDHDKTVALFNAASNSSSVDPELQAFAKKTLPTLEHHQMMATDLNTKQASASTGTTTR